MKSGKKYVVGLRFSSLIQSKREEKRGEKRQLLRERESFHVSPLKREEKRGEKRQLLREKHRKEEKQRRKKKKMEKEGKSKKIEEMEYYREYTLTEYILEEGIEEIGDHAFNGCENLERVKMVRRVRKIGESAFRFCHSLTKIVFKEGLEEIGDGAFAKTGLEEVTLTKGTRKIGHHCFSNAKKLKTFTIYEGIEEIQYGIFANTYLETLTLPIHNIPTFHKYALGSDVSDNGTRSSRPPLPTLKTLRLRLPLPASFVSIPFPRITEIDDGQLVRFIKEQQQKYRQSERQILDTIFVTCFALKCTRMGLYNAYGTSVLVRIFRFWFRGNRALFPIQRSALRF